jgi:hypothetical protein
MTSLPLTGGCLCGGVRFEISEPLVSAAYCHCTRCQRRTGTAAAASARTAPGSLRILSGEELVRAYEPPDGFAKLFCSACGSALFSRDPADPSAVSVRLGAIDGDPGIRPSHRHHVETAAVWEPIPDDGLPRRVG